GFEIVEDDFVESRNLDQIDRVEDRHLGMRFSAQVGYAGQGWGSSDDAWIVRSNYHDSLLRTKKSTIVFDADLGGRIEGGAARNMQLSLSSRYDRRVTEHQLFHAGVVASVGTHLDLDNPSYLGGDSGLRGYPLRYLGGDTSLLLTVEQRIFTDWYPFRLFNVGGAVFADAGRTWGADPAGGPALGWLRDVGFGLRIGNSRSSVGRMIHIDLAFPLDGEADISSVQLLVEAKKGF
ncbi:MAG TPA: hypothetical protein VFE85_04195, partial [Woeseiaceae bacterium]|nr:hypothetical protein [Woeseiaceae bacterium]